jgi:hypothetical protein
MSATIPATKSALLVVGSGEDQKAVFEIIIRLCWFLNLGISLCHDKL